MRINAFVIHFVALYSTGAVMLLPPCPFATFWSIWKIASTGYWLKPFSQLQIIQLLIDYHNQAPINSLIFLAFLKYKKKIVRSSSSSPFSLMYSKLTMQVYNIRASTLQPTVSAGSTFL